MSLFQELKNGETSAKNSVKSDVVDDIAKITETNAVSFEFIIQTFD